MNNTNQSYPSYSVFWIVQMGSASACDEQLGMKCGQLLPTSTPSTLRWEGENCCEKDTPTLMMSLGMELRFVFVS